MSQSATDATTTATPRRSLRDEVLPFAVFLVVGFALQMARNAQESTLWRDEIYTMMLATRPLADLVDLTAVDAHPPLYYFVARAWWLLGTALGLEPGVTWMRGLNMVGWTATASLLWFAGRRLFGAWPGALGAIAGMASGTMTEVFRNLRNYTFVCPALLGCAVILAFGVRHALDRDKPQPAGRVALLWLLYAVLGSLALWMHLLSALALTALGLTWMVACVVVWRARSWKMVQGIALGGAVAQMAIIVGFLPWLAVVKRQLEYIASVELLWMTPPTLYNGLRVFAVWYPMGNVSTLGIDGWSQPVEALALGLVSVLTLALAGLLAVLRPAALGERISNGTAMAVATVLLVALLNVGIQMAVMALGISKTFHGLRYPAITAPVFALAMGGVLALAVARFQWPGSRSLLLVAPWLVACLYGNVWVVTREANSGVEGVRPFLAESTRGAREPVYLTPWRLFPLHRHSFRGFDVRPLADAFQADGADQLNILNLNHVFYETDRIDERLDMALLISGDTRAGGRRWELPPGSRAYEFLQVTAPDTPEMRRRREAARRRLERPGPPSAVSIAHAARQRRADGWSSAVASKRGLVSRWGQRPAAIVRFDAPVPPGRWQLVLRGMRLPLPNPVEVLTLQVGDDGPTFNYRLSPGPFELVTTIDHPGGDQPLTLRLEHPLARFEGAVDERRGVLYQSVRFDEAWVELVAEAPPPTGS